MPSSKIIQVSPNTTGHMAVFKCEAGGYDTPVITMWALYDDGSVGGLFGIWLEEASDCKNFEGFMTSIDFEAFKFEQAVETPKQP